MSLEATGVALPNFFKYAPAVKQAQGTDSNCMNRVTPSSTVDPLEDDAAGAADVSAHCRLSSFPCGDALWQQKVTHVM